MSTLTSHSLGSMHAVHLAQVLDNDDPQSRGRIKVKMLATNIEIWANVVVASAGNGYGVTCLPKVEEKVVVAFVTQDQALVIGSIWTGNNPMPNDANTIEDHYVIATPSGSVVEFDDAQGPKIMLKTRSGYNIKIDESNGGEISINRDSQSVTLSSSEVKVQATKIVLDASSIEFNAPQITANAAISSFSGVIQCDSAISNAVVGTSYTPGAGNIW